MPLFHMTVKTFILYGISRPKMSQGHFGPSIAQKGQLGQLGYLGLQRTLMNKLFLVTTSQLLFSSTCIFLLFIKSSLGSLCFARFIIVYIHVCKIENSVIYVSEHKY